MFGQQRAYPNLKGLLASSPLLGLQGWRMNSSSCEQLMQILIHILQDAKKQHCNTYFRHDCPSLCIPFASGIFLLFFTFLMKVIIDLHCGETPAHEHWKKLRLNLGTAEPAIVYPNLHFPYGGTWTPTYSAVLAFCRSFWTFISTKENVLCLTETSCLNRNVSPVFFLAWPLILVSCTREIQSLQSQFY